MNAAAVERVGTRLSKILNMVNTSMFVFKHPKYYTELRKLRNKEARRVPGCLPTNELHNSDQVISNAEATAASERAPGPGLKQQASSSEGSSENLRSSKPQAPSIKLSNQPEQASSDKHQAPSNKRQA